MLFFSRTIASETYNMIKNNCFENIKLIIIKKMFKAVVLIHPVHIIKFMENAFHFHSELSPENILELH